MLYYAFFVILGCLNHFASVYMEKMYCILVLLLYCDCVLLFHHNWSTTDEMRDGFISCVMKTYYEVEGSRRRGRPKRTWKEVVQKDCQARNLKKEDAMDHGRWKKLIKIG